METALAIFKAWDNNTQALVITSFMLFLVSLCWLLLRYSSSTLIALLRGYPLNNEVRYCDHDDNLTSKCLKPGGCRTQTECDQVIATLNIGLATNHKDNDTTDSTTSNSST